ncbi:MAG: demethylase [Bacteroidales bacterium]|nr:demethylase [Bacteroidales bacterium]MBD5341914.1 demethylase [Bacteroides sp.]MBD5364790.1 demethylase [Bacteroides sp.]
MAKQIERGRFLLIECTAGELMDAVGSDICICDWCGRPFAPSEKGVYIAVLNHWYCMNCFNDWFNRSTYYPEDADVERKNFEFYAPRFGINVSKCS